MKLKFLFALSFTALLSLTSCISMPKTPISGMDPLDEDVLDKMMDKVGVENYEAVYGNVYLPEQMDGYKIVWQSDNNDIINPNWDGDKAPGMVNRPSQDTDVQLDAYIIDEANNKGSCISQIVTVKGLEYVLEDDDYEAYLFAHFIGEGTGETKDGVKIATGEQIFFALADVGEGLHFKDMNGSTSSNLKPVLTSDVGERGVRDPFMCRSPEGDTFYLIATDLSVYTRGGWNNNAGEATKTGSHSIIIWESHDLVNWTHARQIPVARDDAGMAWAPEMIYCEETGEYYIFFSSTVLDDYSLGVNAKILERDCVYYTTTRDFVHFSETKKFISNIKYPDGYNNTQERDQYAINNDYRKVIDGSVMKIGDYYYSACKDGGNNENHGGIRIQKTESLLPEWQDRPDGEQEEAVQWEFVQNLADVGFQAQGRNADNKCLEGPEWFIYNVDDRKDPSEIEIGLMADFYANTSVGYIPWATTDIEDVNNENGSWRILESGEDKDFSWDKQTKRHGTILRITAKEAEKLKIAYPIAK